MTNSKLKIFVHGRGMYKARGYQYHKQGISIYVNDSIGLHADDWYHRSVDDVVILPYVGLKDSDKADIHVGDILQNIVDNMLLNWVVCFNGYAFTLKNISSQPLETTKEFPINDPHVFIDRKVIGNIHQNPELLEGTE